METGLYQPIGEAIKNNTLTVPRKLHHFPDVCIDSLSTNQPFPNLYYGRDLVTNYLEATFSVRLITIADIEAMEQFWYTDLNEGVLPFYITLPIFGKTHQFTAILKSDIRSSWEDHSVPKKQTVTIKILDNIEEIFNANDFDITIKSPKGGDVTVTVDGIVNVDWGYGVIEQHFAGTFTGRPFGEMRITSTDEITTFKIDDGGEVTEVKLIKAESLVDASNIMSGLENLERVEFLDTPNIENMESAFEDTPRLCQPPMGMDLPKVTNVTRIFKDSSIMYLDSDLSNADTFTSAFDGAKLLQCIQHLDTVGALDTTDMFNNTPALVYPDSADQGLIEAGTDWVNTVVCTEHYEHFLQNYRYDSRNMHDTFDTLAGVTLDSGVLTATHNGGYAISKALHPDNLTMKFIALKSSNGTVCGGAEKLPFEAKFRLVTIADVAHTVANELHSHYPIVDGDKIVIIKADHTIHEMVANGVNQPSNTIDGDGSQNPSITNEAIAANGASPSGNSCPFVRCGYYGVSNKTPSTFKFNIPTVINKCRLRSPHYGYAIRNYKVTASNTGAFAGEEVELTGWVNPSGFRSWTNDVPYLYYRVTYGSAVYSRNGGKIQTVDLIAAVGKQTITNLDTTAITQGEKPLMAYIVNPTVEFSPDGINFMPAVPNNYAYSVDTAFTNPLDPFNDKSLVAKYMLNGDTKDLTGNYDGVGTGITFKTDDEFGDVADFTTGKCVTPFKTSMIDTTYTIAFFARRNDLKHYDDAFSEHGGGAGRRKYGTNFDFDGNDSSSGGRHGYGGTKQWDSTGRVKVAMDRYVNMKEMNHYAFSRVNGFEHKLYANCVKVGEKSAPRIDSGRHPSSEFFTIGGSDHFRGDIAILEIYNRDLNAEEICQLAHQRKGSLYVTISFDDIHYPVGDQSLHTKITLGGVGDSMESITGELIGEGL